MSHRIYSIFGVTHSMERVSQKKLVSSFFINHFNQIAVQCSRLFSVYHIGSTNEMHTDFIFVLVPFSFSRFLYFSLFFSIIRFRHRCVLAAQSTKNSVTENLMSRKNQIHCIIRLMTCYVHLTERSIVPLRFLRIYAIVRERTTTKYTNFFH